MQYYLTILPLAWVTFWFQKTPSHTHRRLTRNENKPVMKIMSLKRHIIFALCSETSQGDENAWSRERTFPLSRRWWASSEGSDLASNAVDLIYLPNISNDIRKLFIADRIHSCRSRGFKTNTQGVPSMLSARARMCKNIWDLELAQPNLFQWASGKLLCELGHK